MTRVNFYIIEQGSADAIDNFICRLTEKVWSQESTVYIHTQGHDHAVKFDDLLWTYKEEGFIPHQVVAEDNDDQSVLIGHENSAEMPNSHHGVLINLNEDIPPFFSQFDRVAEIISGDENSRAKGRERYQFYRDRGYALETHKMSL